MKSHRVPQSHESLHSPSRTERQTDGNSAGDLEEFVHTDGETNSSPPVPDGTERRIQRQYKSALTVSCSRVNHPSMRRGEMRRHVPHSGSGSVSEVRDPVAVHGSRAYQQCDSRRPRRSAPASGRGPAVRIPRTSGAVGGYTASHIRRITEGGRADQATAHHARPIGAFDLGEVGRKRQGRPAEMASGGPPVMDRPD